MTTDQDGYTYGAAAVPTSPVPMEDLALLEATLLWTDEDSAALQRAGDVLADQTDAILDLWYGYVGSHPHLVASFAGADGQPDGAYLAAVRLRFARWIVDVCRRPRDATWLAYQEEIAQRHHPAKKNRTDGVESPATHVPMRYLVAFVWPITATIRQFLAAKGDPPADVEAMHQAWFKAVTLSVVLWCRPYSPDLW